MIFGIFKTIKVGGLPGNPPTLIRAQNYSLFDIRHNSCMGDFIPSA